MRGLLPVEQGTRLFFGKLYHWTRVDGRMVLVAGAAPEDLDDEVAEEVSA